MSSTYLSLHYHLVFSTKNRLPLIEESWLSDLHKYMGGTVTGLGGVPQEIDGIADHVHLLVGLKATHCLADFMRELKKAATVRVHEVPKNPNFTWQEGYSAFTVSPTAREAVGRYIANQAEHHQTKQFRQELIEMLRMAEVEFEEKYLD